MVVGGSVVVVEELVVVGGSVVVVDCPEALQAPLRQPYAQATDSLYTALLPLLQ